MFAAEANVFHFDVVCDRYCVYIFSLGPRPTHDVGVVGRVRGVVKCPYTSCALCMKSCRSIDIAGS